MAELADTHETCEKCGNGSFECDQCQHDGYSFPLPEPHLGLTVKEHMNPPYTFQGTSGGGYSDYSITFDGIGRVMVQCGQQRVFISQTSVSVERVPE